MEALVHQKRSLVLILVKQTQNFVDNADNSYFLDNRKEIFKFKAYNKNVNFPTQFCPGSISNRFSATESKEVSLNGNVYHVSVQYNSIDKSDILNIHKCLMTQNNIKQCSALLNKCLLYY